MKKTTIAVYLTAFLLLALPLAVSAQSPEADIGVITYVKGDVNLLREGKSFPLKVDEKIKKGDTIEATPNGKARVIFSAGDLQGMKVVPGGEKLEIDKLLSQKPAERTLSSLAADVLQSFDQKEKPQEIVATTRDAKNSKPKMLIYPDSNLSGSVREIIWRPLPKATTYACKLEYLGDAGKVSKAYESKQPFLKDGLPEFQPGVLYSLKVTALEDKKELAQDEVAFTPPTPSDADAAFKTAFAEMEKAIADPEDPTIFLLKGNSYFSAGFYGEAARSYLAYARLAGKTERISGLIRQALLKLKFLPSEVDESINPLLGELGKAEKAH